MAFDYAGSQQTALRILTNFGQDVEVRRFSGSTFNGVTGEHTGGADIVDTVKAAPLPSAGRKSDYFAEDIVIKAESYAIIEAVNTTYTPSPGDRLVIDNITHEIIGSSTFNPAGVQLVHTVALIKR